MDRPHMLLLMDIVVNKWEARNLFSIPGKASMWS
jgi:hypothetical protein